MGEKAKKTVISAVIALFLLSSAFVIFGMHAVSAAPEPGVPTGVTAVIGYEQVSLSWTAPVSNVDNPIDYYVIHRETGYTDKFTGEFTATSPLNETIWHVGIELPDNTAVFTAIIAGLPHQYASMDFIWTYSFTVAAHNVAGIVGPQSDQVIANPYTAPNPISDISITSGDRQVTIRWETHDNNWDDGGAKIDEIAIYQDGIYLAPATANKVTINGLENGHSYNFSVAKRGVWGHSLLNNQTAIPMATPDAPTGLSAIASNAQVKLTWTVPANSGESFINGYSVYRGEAIVAESLDTSTTITELLNNQTYIFSVSAHNTLNYYTAGPKSSSVSATPRPEASNEPTGLTAMPGDKQVQLSWLPPNNNGGAKIDHYVIYQNGVALLDHPTGQTHIVTGLTNGQSYSFTVAAHNYVGIGPSSSSVQSIPYSIPNAPTGLEAIAGNGQVSLNWTASFDSGRGVDYYIVSQDGVALPYHLSGPSANITGLNNGQTYSFTVAGHNLAGISSQSNTKVATPFASAQSPSGLKAVPGNAKVSLTWTVPLSNGGSAILNYVVYQNGVDVQHVFDTSAEIKGLTSGVNYYFAVAAQNAAGIGPMSAVVTATPNPALTVPGVPTGLTVTPGDRQVALAWSLPENHGGATIDYYVVYQDNVVVSNVSGNSVTITGLTNGQAYSFSVADHNVVGVGSQSIAVQATPFTFAEAPRSLTATPGNGFVTLKWNAPINDGGSAIDHYVVSQNGVVLSNDTTGLTLVITGLTNGQTYNFTVAAHNLAGVGPYSYIVVTPTQTVPSEPLNLSSSTIDGGIVLEWSAPADNGGYLAIYQVFRGSTNGSESLLVNTTGNSYTDKAINLGTNYYYFVKAINQLGSSIPSKEIGPIYASAYVLVHIETESSSSIGVVMTVSGNVMTAIGSTPIAGLNIDLSYSANNGQTWIDMPSVKTSSTGNFTSQWIPAATGDYVLKASWAGNPVYQTANSSVSLAVDTSSDKYVFTVQSNSTVSALSFNSVSKELSFNVSGATGTFGYSRIVISKQLVANGSDIKVSLDGQDMSYQLSSTDSSWILYFEYHHSTHSIVATLSPASTVGTNGGANDSPLPLLAIAGLAVVTALMLTGLVVFNRRRTRK